MLLVGGSLFATTLSQTLLDSEMVRIVATAPTISQALPLLAATAPDVLILAGSGNQRPENLIPVLDAYPDLSIIYADLKHDYIQVITSQRVGTRRSDLLAAIAALPKQRPSQGR